MREFDEMLINFCAPTLFGVKQANLFSCSERDAFEYVKKYNMFLNQKDIYFRVLYQCKNRYFIIVYRSKALKRYFQNRTVTNYLTSLGYPAFYEQENNLEMLLDCLSKRTSCHKDFPHEIGFFFGISYGRCIPFYIPKRSKLQILRLLESL